jgi:ribonuclease-3
MSGDSNQRSSPLDPCLLKLAELVAELPNELREQALTLPAWVKDERRSSKRLAHLGDSLLYLFLAEYLQDRFPKCSVGELTEIRSQTVSGLSCDVVGRALGVPGMLEEIEKSKREIGAPAEMLLEASPRPVAETTEALIGASRLAFGIEGTRHAVIAAFEGQIEANAKAAIKPKSRLDEELAQRQMHAVYEVIVQSGSGSRRKFEVSIFVDSEQIGQGVGYSKKFAENAAAQQALARHPW